MILVDVQIPAMDRVYDFELDEGLTAGILTQDIETLVLKRENLMNRTASEAKQGLAENLSRDSFLYSMRQESILKREETLKQQGVRDGDRLILIN